MSTADNNGGSVSTKISDRHPEGWIVLSRSEMAEELPKSKPKAAALLWQIAQRAKRSNSENPEKLQACEALIRGCEDVGLTDKEYRIATAQLENLGLVATRRASKGKVFRLIGIGVFDINESVRGEDKGERGASKGRAENRAKPELMPINIGRKQDRARLHKKKEA